MLSRSTCINRYFVSLVLLVAVLFSAGASAQSIEKVLMPGEVISGHAKYENECEQCHQRFDKKAQTRLCLDCHKDIATDVRTKRRLHGKLDNTSCNLCHVEHKGRAANIAPWTRKNSITVALSSSCWVLTRKANAKAAICPSSSSVRHPSCAMTVIKKLMMKRGTRGTWVPNVKAVTTRRSGQKPGSITKRPSSHCLVANMLMLSARIVTKTRHSRKHR